MMRSTFDVECNSRSISSDVLVQSSCSPWIVLTIREDGIRVSEEVFVNVASTKEVKGPIVVWSQPVVLLALLGVSIVIELVRNEHRFFVVADRHGELIASEDVPTVGIKTASSFPVTEIGAGIVASVVEIDAG